MDLVPERDALQLRVAPGLRPGTVATPRPGRLRQRICVVAQAIEHADRIQTPAAVERIEPKRVGAVRQALLDVQRADAAEAAAERRDREAARQPPGRDRALEPTTSRAAWTTPLGCTALPPRAAARAASMAPMP